jgi:hypothetical protein
MLSEDNASDHGIPQIARAALLMSGCHQVTCLFRRSDVESYNSMADLVENFLERLNQSRPPFATGHDLQSESDFKERDRSCPN